MLLVRAGGELSGIEAGARSSDLEVLDEVEAEVGLLVVLIEGGVIGW